MAHIRTRNRRSQKAPEASWLLCAGRDDASSDTDGHAFQPFTRRREPFHDQGVVPWNYMRRRVGEGANEVEGPVHPGQVGDDAERAVLLHVRVEMRRVRGENDVPPSGLDLYDLQPGRVPADPVRLDAPYDLLGPLTKLSRPSKFFRTR